ncbi:hypothetical protein AU255_10080 [Methyloprofundus sedimenti]|uniref:Uncharacterized protein n=1 Tax=Methyloprofundus sedimenti TaxID=1420851 RepID=A0A1V8M958_9GAMM|nr:hypothetical protein [Methyloprofundus sedimenti]OQK18160.1 hypothetical protein AU255_10080 [Methyloprofundus sedimenti]
MFNQFMLPSRTHVKNCLIWLSILSALIGCQSTGALQQDPKPAIAEIRSILVVAVEAPPLEVTPDLLTTRMPVYQEYEDITLPMEKQQKIYRNPGGILITGLVGEGDSVTVVSYTQVTNAQANDQCRQAFYKTGDWMPTLAVSDQAITQLNAMHIKTPEYPATVNLPLSSDDRSSPYLDSWREAIQQWYEKNDSAIDINQLQASSVDAVLEIGIGHYKIFEGQIALQLLVKLIDADTGKVVARNSQSTRLYETTAQALLAYQGVKFKAKVSEMGMQMLMQYFQELGLQGKHNTVSS